MNAPSAPLNMPPEPPNMPPEPPSQSPRSRRLRVIIAAILGFALACLCVVIVMKSRRSQQNEVEDLLKEQSKEIKQQQQRQQQIDEALAEQSNQIVKRMASMEYEINSVKKDLGDTKKQENSVQNAAAFGHEEASSKKAPNQKDFAEPVWNVWLEPYSAGGLLYTPQKIQPDKDYSFVVNLAALSYDQDISSRDAGVYSQRADPSFVHWLEKPSQLPTREVQLLVIPDRLVFERQLQGQVFRPFSINVEKMRRVHSTGFRLSGSALEHLRLYGESSSDFSFGITSFHFKTSPDAKLGMTSIAVSIWVDGMPMGEISYSVCIVRALTDRCDSSQLRPGFTLKGVDLSKLDHAPDAALQIIDRQSDVVGVFRCNSCGWEHDKYLVWRVAETEKDFAEQVKKIVRRLGKIPKLPSQAEYEERFRSTSNALYNILFGPTGGPQPSESQVQAANVRAALNDFIVKSRNEVLSGRKPLSLFVRLIPSERDLVLTPIALMEVETPPPTAHVTGPLYPNYIGFYVDIQAPLEFQDYSHSSSCLSQWVLFVPPPQPPAGGDYQDVEDARNAFESWIDKFQDACRDCVKQDSTLKGFQAWLSSSSVHAGGIVALSHHDDALGLYFDSSGDPAIITGDIARTFNEPAVAILAACGTAEPGGADFISEFNAHKVYTVIATSSPVDPNMAGTFLSLLMESLDQKRTDSDYTVGKARFDAVRALSTKKDLSDVPYGARALEFILAGNGSVRLCPPKGS